MDEDDPSLPKINIKTRKANDPDPDVPPIQEKTVKEKLEPVQLAQIGKKDGKEDDKEDKEDSDLPKIHITTRKANDPNPDVPTKQEKTVEQSKGIDKQNQPNKNQ